MRSAFITAATLASLGMLVLGFLLGQSVSSVKATISPVPDCVCDCDGDGVDDPLDACPLDYKKIDPGLCGCGQSDTDDPDGDGVVACLDECPFDPNQSRPPCGICVTGSQAYTGPCACGAEASPADLDYDCDVDLEDYQIFQAEFSGIPM